MGFILSWVSREKISPTAGILALWGPGLIRIEHVADFSISDVVFEHTKDVPTSCVRQQQQQERMSLNPNHLHACAAAIGKFSYLRQLLVYSLQPWASRKRRRSERTLLNPLKDNNNNNKFFQLQQVCCPVLFSSLLNPPKFQIDKIIEFCKPNVISLNWD